jgi:hypothetical protein
MEEEYEIIEKKINFKLKLKLTSGNTYSIEYVGETAEDDRLINMKKYGSGAHGIDPRSNKTLNKIKEINRKLKALRFPDEWKKL